MKAKIRLVIDILVENTIRGRQLNELIRIAVFESQLVSFAVLHLYSYSD